MIQSKTWVFTVKVIMETSGPPIPECMRWLKDRGMQFGEEFFVVVRNIVSDHSMFYFDDEMVAAEFKITFG